MEVFLKISCPPIFLEHELEQPSPSLFHFRETGVHAHLVCIILVCLKWIIKLLTLIPHVMIDEIVHLSLPKGF